MGEASSTDGGISRKTMNDIIEQKEENLLEIIKNELTTELESRKNELSEIELMLEHRQGEVGKLTERNAAMSANLSQLKGQLENLPRKDILSIYDTAIDVRQRLFEMRGQLEKLHSDQAHLKQYIATLDHVLQTLQSSSPTDFQPAGSIATSESVEMLIQAQEAERQRLSRQMHDGPAQALSNFILQTEIAMRLFAIDQNKAKDELANLKTSATSTFQKVRDFIFELRPMMLDDLGIVPTLKRYVDAFHGRQNVEITLTVTGVERRLEAYLEVMLFRAIQELLGNALKHSQASQVKILVDMGDNDIRVMVEDNGKGFDETIINNRGNMGLRVIKERVEMLGGSFDLESIANQGTTVTFKVPAAELEVLS